jgi:hypothetical protein
MNVMRDCKLELAWLLVILFLALTPATFIAQDQEIRSCNWTGDECDCTTPGWCLIDF